MSLSKEKDSESNPKLRFSPLALADIKGTWEYLSEQGDEVSAQFIRQIMDKCEFISQNPKVGREKNEIILKLRQFPFKNYNIYYFIAESGIEVYRILHSSRDNIHVIDETIDE